MQGKADFDTIANFVLMPHLTEPAPYRGQVMAPMHGWRNRGGGGTGRDLPLRAHLFHFLGGTRGNLI